MTDPLSLRDLAEIGVGRLKGVGEKRERALREVGIESVLDLLTHYPRRWVDRTNEARVADLRPGEEALVLVTLRTVSKRTMRNHRTMVTADAGDDWAGCRSCSSTNRGESVSFAPTCRSPCSDARRPIAATSR